MYKNKHPNKITDFTTTKEIQYKYSKYCSQLGIANIPKESAQRLDLLQSILIKAFPDTLFSFYQFKAVFDIIEKHNFSKKQIIDLIYGQKTLNTSSPEFISKKDTLAAIIEKEKEKLDIDTYTRINEISKTFANNTDFLNHEVIRACVDAIKGHSKRINSQLGNFTEEEFDSLEAFGQLLSNIKFNVTNHITNSEKDSSLLANEIIEKLAEYYKDHTNAILTQEQATTFSGLLKILSHKPTLESSREYFTPNELVDFISNNLSLVFTVDYEKAIINRNVLTWYFKKLQTTTQDYNSLDTVSQLQKECGKNVIIRNSSILNELNTNLYESLQFLLGNNVSRIYENSLNDKDNLNVKYGNKRKTRDALCSLFPNMKISNMTANKHLEIIQENPQLLSKFTLDRLYTTTEKIIDAICNAYNLCNHLMSLKEKKRLVEDLGFDTSSLFDGDNIVSIFTNTPVDTTNLRNNIRILSDYLTPSQIQMLIKHNFDLLCKKPSILLLQVKQIESHSPNEIFQELLSKAEIETPSNLEDLEKYSQFRRNTKVRYSNDTIASPLMSIRANEYKTPQDVQLQVDKKLQKLEDEVIEETKNGDEDSTSQLKERMATLIDHLKLKQKILTEKLQKNEQRSDAYYKLDRIHNKHYTLPDEDYLSVAEALKKQLANCKFDVAPSDIPSQLDDIKASAHERFVHERHAISRVDNNITNLRLEISTIEKIIEKLKQLLSNTIDSHIKEKELESNIEIIKNMFERLLQILQKDIPDERKSKEIKRTWATIIFANKKITELTGISLLDASLNLSELPEGVVSELSTV